MAAKLYLTTVVYNEWTKVPVLNVEDFGVHLWILTVPIVLMTEIVQQRVKNKKIVNNVVKRNSSPVKEK